MPNIELALYAWFKLEGYRINSLGKAPVTSIPQLVQLAYPTSLIDAVEALMEYAKSRWLFVELNQPAN